MKNNKILIISVIVLFLLFIFSFVKEAGKEKKSIVKTALVNEKYEKSINSFILTQGEDELYLKKENNIWLVSKGVQDDSFLPVAPQKVENFIKDLIKVVNLYKISDNLPKNNQYGFDSSECFSVKYSLGSDNSFSGYNEILFGNYDFSKTSRYLMSGKKSTVYEIDTNLDKYLSVLLQTWSDPYIVSKTIADLSASKVQKVTVKTPQSTVLLTPKTEEYTTKIEKLLELRHGGAGYFSFDKTDSSVMELKLEGGNLTSTNINIFETENPDEFFVEVTYELELEKQSYCFYEKISSWTYNKIKEIML